MYPALTVKCSFITAVFVDLNLKKFILVIKNKMSICKNALYITKSPCMKCNLKKMLNIICFLDFGYNVNKTCLCEMQPQSK